MPIWYHLTIETAESGETNRADAFERALVEILGRAPPSPFMEVYSDGLAARRGRIYWLSENAFEAARDLALQHGAEAYPGLVDMRFLMPLSF